MDEAAAKHVAFFADEVDGAGNSFLAIFDDGVVVNAPPDIGEGAARGAGELVAGDGLELEESSGGSAVDDEVEPVGIDALEGTEKIVGVGEVGAADLHIDFLAGGNAGDGCGKVLEDIDAERSGFARDVVEKLLPGPGEDAVQVAGRIPPFVGSAEFLGAVLEISGGFGDVRSNAAIHRSNGLLCRESL
jgi:hypothetical protein